MLSQQSSCFLRQMGNVSHLSQHVAVNQHACLTYRYMLDVLEQLDEETGLLVDLILCMQYILKFD